MARKEKIGVLVSGGLDSNALVCTLLKEGYEVWPIYVRCHLRWEKSELHWVHRFIKTINSDHVHQLKQLSISLGGAYRKNWSQTDLTPDLNSSNDAVYLPARNLLLITRALLYLSSHGIHHLGIATLKGNPFSDGNRPYFQKLSDVLSKSFNKPIKIKTPFHKMEKSEIIHTSRHFPLHLSLSCINPKKHNHCGVCNKCAERQRAFKDANVPDKTVYLN